MSPKATAILFAVAAALAAFVWFYEIEGGEQRQQAEEAEKRLFAGVEQENIDAITLHTSDGVRVRLRRVDDRWRISDPIDFAADGFAVDGLASALVSLQSESLIEEPRGRDVYGLDAEDRVVQFTVGGDERILRTGYKAPVGENAYVSVDDSDAVYIVESYRVDSLQKAFDDLRDKRISQFDTNAVDRFELTWPGERVVIERSDDGWMITAPFQARAGAMSVDELLGDLAFLRANGFVDDVAPEDEAGLDRPVFAAVIGLEGEGTADLEIAISGIAVDGTLRLVRSAEKSLYTIPAARLDAWPTGPSAFRFRQLAQFSALDATRIEFGFLTSGGATLGITATRGEDGWTSAPESFETGKLDSLVTELSRLRADSILADELGLAELEAIGLDPPGALISVYADGEGDPIAEVHFGTPRPEGIPAQIPGATTVFQLPAAAAEQIPVSHEAFRNRFVAPPPPPEPESSPDPEPQPVPEPHPT